MPQRIFVGTAGWALPRASAHRFAIEGTHLERYSRLFPCAEINSSFHRPHAVATYAKWACATPPDFRFAVKMPRAITHDRQLRRSREPLERFVQETGGLGDKRGPVLVQLPPSLAFDARVAVRFFDLMRSFYDGLLVCEPRHVSWFSAQANAVLIRFSVARVAADPPPAQGAEHPGGWTGVAYYRLHGAPRKYWSRYDGESIAALAHTLRLSASASEVWCVFDNTASGAALENASELKTILAADGF
jgi:uncharacterized protein YecE (DUF72 family)